MNHRTHSGSSPTVITNPNAFDSSNTAKTNSTSQAIPNSDNKRNHQHHQRSNVAKSAISSDRSTTSTAIPTTNTRTQSRTATVLDFDALESCPIDSVTADDTTNQSIVNSVISQYSNNADTTNSAHISAVFKKLTTYFSTSSHKTLTNLTFSNHKSRQLNHLSHRHTQKLGDHKQFSCKTITSIDNCAVFENCNAVSVPVSSSNESEFSCDDTSPLPSDKQTTFVTTQPHNKKPINLHHHSSDRINGTNKISLSANAMCRADDKYALDGRTTAITTTTMPSNTQSPTKRTKDLKTTIETTGETFSLPRVTLRQR